MDFSHVQYLCAFANSIQNFSGDVILWSLSHFSVGQFPPGRVFSPLVGVFRVYFFIFGWRAFIILFTELFDVFFLAAAFFGSTSESESESPAPATALYEIFLPRVRRSLPSSAWKTNQQKFLTLALVQWLARWPRGHEVEGSNPAGRLAFSFSIFFL